MLCEWGTQIASDHQTALSLNCQEASPATVLVLRSPKRGPSEFAGQRRWFSLYASFSQDFVRDAFLSLGLGPRARVLDPWNGTGTTTAVARSLGYEAHGVDINPAMVLIARAREVQEQPRETLRALLTQVIQSARAKSPMPSEDPLLSWLQPSSAGAARALESAIRTAFGLPIEPCVALDRSVIEAVSPPLALLYVALFRSVREVLKGYRSSNPTWLRLPASPSNRLRPSPKRLRDEFKRTAEEMLSAFSKKGSESRSPAQVLRIGSSDALPLEAQSIDGIVTSPPYCTRIDYVMSSRVELALLGYRDLTELRKASIGSPIVASTVQQPSPEWGDACNSLLQRIRLHPSKASSSYYYKTHVQYFRGLYASLCELDRVLKPGGKCVFVVQDSYYKELHNDLRRILTEMVSGLGWNLAERFSFPNRRNLVDINRNSRAHMPHRLNQESALFFSKPRRAMCQTSPKI